MLELLLIRHGQTDWNLQQKVMGRQPIPLNATGRRQAGELAAFLAGARIDAVYTSPVRRAQETAEIIARGREGLAVEDEEGLAEIDYGEWVNLTFAELTEKHRETWRRYREDPNDLVLPGGESMPQVVARVARVVADVRRRFADGRVALVSHADVIKLLLLDILGLDVKNILRLSIDNCAMLLVRFHPELGPRLVVFNPANGFGKDM